MIFKIQNIQKEILINIMELTFIVNKNEKTTPFIKAWTYIGRINGLLFIIYTISILFFSLYLLVDEPSLLIRGLLIIIMLALLICPPILRRVSRISLPILVSSDSNNSHIKRIASFFVVSLLINLIRFFAFYPGTFSQDAISQYHQAITNIYNDWHPVFQTLFAIKLPLLLTGGWVASIALFQILLFSAVLSYTCYSIAKYTKTIYSVIIFAFITLNPQIGNFVVICVKDTTFSIGALLLAAYVLNIYFTKGKWFEKKFNTVAFIISIALTTLFRHNAILYTLPLLIAVLLYSTKKQGIIIALASIILIIGIKYPLYGALGVESPDKRQIEMMGLPMVVIGAVVKYNPNALDETTKEFVYKIADQEVWDENYSYGNYNYVKWDSRTNNDVIEEYSPLEIINMMLKCIKRSPVASTKGLVALTSPVYSIYDHRISSQPPETKIIDYYKDYNIYTSGNEQLQKLNNTYCDIMITLFPHLFMYIGSMMFLLLCSILAKCNLRKKDDWKTILFVLPVFAYNFGTMFLLTGTYDTIRLFNYTFLVTPIMLIIVMTKKKI